MKKRRKESKRMEQPTGIDDRRKRKQQQHGGGKVGRSQQGLGFLVPSCRAKARQLEAVILSGDCTAAVQMIEEDPGLVWARAAPSGDYPLINALRRVRKHMCAELEYRGGQCGGFSTKLCALRELPKLVHRTNEQPGPPAHM